MNNTKMIVSKTFEFDFSHQLPNHFGKCKNLHGHRGKLFIAVEDSLNDKTGMVIDYIILKQIVDEKILSVLDHNHLNNILAMPTAENICLWVWSELQNSGLNLKCIKFWETPNSCCELTKEHMEEYRNQYKYEGDNISTSINEGSLNG